ncbi:hypothetical protein [Agarilytica rhodophyticola]|uniref:hypothetical protein n=1 Tax=Agarilytica rhodophyticola TaxID=1737490 RepID=UPI000B345012|nr:hypothetical protein [Agarilytica rhodophyticola]
MSEKSLKSMVRRIATQPHLSNERVESLQQLLQTEKKRHFDIFPFLWGMAASLVFFVGIYGVKLYQADSSALLVSEEVVKNHIKLKPLEIEDEHFNILKQYFTELDFVPVESSIGFLKKSFLIGGRYCSISGEPAAQLRYLDSNDKLTTVYQVGYDQEKFSWVPDKSNGAAPVEKQVRGLNVKIWREKGLVFASVQ